MVKDRAVYRLSSDDAQRAHRALRAWYEQVKRPLPWRKTRDPYAIWISEIMCQQTRVDTVIPYYQRWLARFPDPQTLAAASLEDVLLIWQGLGYYRRARYLHAGAIYAVEHLDGQLPQTAEELQKLPGIGPYTAGAIASIAFDERVPAIDGNLQRVLTRLSADDGNIARAATMRRLRTLGTQLVDFPNPGDTNQALMELGASLCSPTTPQCDLCPLLPWCSAAKEGDPTRFPVKSKAKKQRKAHRHAYVARRPTDQALFVAQRDASALLGGLWETPLFETPPEHEAWTKKGEIRHLFTHIDLRVTVWVALDAVEIPPLRTLYRDTRWALRHELDQVPQSTLMRKILALTVKSESR